MAAAGAGRGRRDPRSHGDGLPALRFHVPENRERHPRAAGYFAETEKTDFGRQCLESDSPVSRGFHSPCRTGTTPRSKFTAEARRAQRPSCKNKNSAYSAVVRKNPQDFSRVVYKMMLESRARARLSKNKAGMKRTG